MNDSELNNFMGTEKEAANSIDHPQQKASSPTKSVPDFHTTGILIRKIYSIYKCFPDGTYELISTNSWIDKDGLPKKENKKPPKPIVPTKLKNSEDW